MVLKGGPKPAFYDGFDADIDVSDALINEWQQADGWMEVIADGKTPLKSDVYVAMNRFKVFQVPRLPLNSDGMKRNRI